MSAQTLAIPNCGAFGRGTQRQADPQEDPWSYARRCAGELTHGQIIIAVESGRVVQVDCTEKKRFKSRD